MVSKGRTTHEAEQAGTLYAVTNPEYAKYGAQFPAAETPAEAAGCMSWQWDTYSPWYPDGTIFEVRRVISATIGCTYVSEVIATFRFEQGAMKEVQ